MLREHVVELAVAILRYELSFSFFAKLMAQVSALKRIVPRSSKPSIAVARGRQDKRLASTGSLLESPHPNLKTEI